MIQIKRFKLIFGHHVVLLQTLLASALLLSFHTSQAAQPLGCLIEPERVADIGSQVIGVVETVKVERGDVVRKGQVLATLRADVERASVQVATSRYQTEAEVRSAEANLELAQVTQKRQEELVHKRFISPQALDKARADTKIAEQKLALSKEDLRTSSSELSLARAQLDQRVIRSPIDGIVTDRFIWPGERVEEKALFRIAKINPLRVEMVISASSYGTISKGMQLKVVPQLPNMPTLDAKVTLVDKLIDGASNTFRARAEIQNPNSDIPSGLRCKVELPDLAQPSATSSDTQDLAPAKPYNKAQTLNNDKIVPAKISAPEPTSSQSSIYKMKLDTKLMTIEKPKPSTRQTVM